MNRQQRRAAEKAMGKKGMEELTRQVMQFGNLPSECSACNKEFDKKDKSMALTWRVIVREDRVRLFCPSCLQSVKEIIDERD